MTDQPTSPRTNNRELFDDWSETFDADVLATGDRFPFAEYQEVLRRITEIVANRAPRSVLDLGCGTGALLARIAAASPAASLIGVDFSRAMLEQARRIVPAARWIEADLAGDLSVHALPRVDVIVASYVLQELPDEAKLVLIERIRRDLLAPDGLIVIGDISFDTSEARDATHETEPFWDDAEHYWAWDELLPTLVQRDIHSVYKQVSFCAGILIVPS